MRYLDRYDRAQGRRHDVKPGITGWAQIKGRNAITWEEKFRLDLWYVDHLTPRVDAQILALTLWTVLRGRNVTAEGHDTMPEFLGSDPSVAARSPDGRED